MSELRNSHLNVRVTTLLQAVHLRLQTRACSPSLFSHTAIVHAFNELVDLQPPEVVILCPNIESAAPYLEAVFDRPVKVSSGRSITIPLVVGDRSLREVSDGADLLNTLLAVTMGRFSVVDVMGLATSSLVRKQFNVSTDSVALWYRIAERARVRWGLDAQQRVHAGLNAPQENAHTWKAAIERTLLGATLPDSAPAIELGGVVPMTDFEVSGLYLNIWKNDIGIILISS